MQRSTRLAGLRVLGLCGWTPPRLRAPLSSAAVRAQAALGPCSAAVARWPPSPIVVRSLALPPPVPMVRHLSSAHNALSDTRFASLARNVVDPRFIAAITDHMRFEHMTDVQAQTLPHLLAGNDVLAVGLAKCPPRFLPLRTPAVPC